MEEKKYYEDILEMQNFYQDVLGLEMVADQGWTKIYQVTNSGFIGLVDERRGMHSYTEEKAVTISFILEDLESWYEYSVEHIPFELRSRKLEVDDNNTIDVLRDAVEEQVENWLHYLNIKKSL